MRFCSVFFFLLIIGVAAQAQTSRAELERRRAALLQEISETQQLLSETKKDKTASLSQLRAVNARLRARQSLINTINAEMNHIDKSIHLTTDEIAQLNRNLALFKSQYAQSIRYAYKTRQTQSVLAFLFSAKDFNDASVRMQYLKRYRDYRKDQADKIRKTQIALNSKVEKLNSEKNQKGQLLSTEELQKSQIEKESQETNQIVRELQGKEKELMNQIAKNKAAAQRLQNAIKAEIQKEIELARKKAAEEARRKAAEEAARKRAEEEAARQRLAAEEAARKRAADEAARKRGEENASGSYQSGSVRLNTGTTTPTSPERPAEKPAEKPEAKPAVTVRETERPSYKLSLTPEVQAISNSFSQNKGSLPWPVVSGFISGQYGQHQHPIYKSVMIDNNGIDIVTSPNAPVRAVFGGTVIKVTNIDGVVVMISHGEFFTVYSNLSGASVRVGDKVGGKQTIGTAGRNEDGESMINFQIWKVGGNNSSFTVNPSEWIAK